MTTKEAAALLNGREYGEEITRDEEKQFKAAGLVAVFGYSDDNCELRGAICDELGCYNGGVFGICQLGVIPAPDDEEAKVLKKFGFLEMVTRPKRKIEAVWGRDGYSWIYRTDIPHETFEILEHGEKYCRGIVFSVESV